MPSLPELQACFAAAIADARHAGGIAPFFRESPPHFEARLAVYRGNVYGNWAKALASTYPITRKIVGAEFFDAMAREYARSHPSASGDLNRYGAHLVRFVAAFPHTVDLAYLPDVARMEWLAHLAYSARDPEPLDIAALGSVAENEYPSLRFGLAPACALLESEWPLGRIWEIHQDDYRGAFEIDLHSGPDRILIHRPRWRAEARSLDAGDFAFLRALLQGDSLGTALEAGAREPGFDPSAALGRWIGLGVVASRV
jgi:hypothetical protein